MRGPGPIIHPLRTGRRGPSPRPMNIALITPAFSGHEADWCIPALLHLFRELARRHQVHVLALQYPYRTDDYEVFGARVHSFGGHRGSGLRRLPRLFHCLAGVRRLHRSGKFDVLHALWADEPGFVGVAASRLLHIPVVVSFMGGELVGLPECKYGVQLSVLGRSMVRCSLAFAHRLTCGSEFLAAMLRRHAAVQDRLIELPLGVDTEFFSPETGDRLELQLAGEHPILQVASLTPIKDHVTSLRAFARLSQSISGVHFHMIGEGPCQPALERLADELRIASSVSFHGKVAHHDLPAYYRGARMCLLSSRFESQAMVLLEAAACGRPTVGTAVGLLPEAPQLGPAVPVGDSEALAEAAEGWLRAPGCWHDAGKQARHLVEEKFDLKGAASRLLELYAGLA